MRNSYPNQTIFNDPEVAIWTGIGVGLCVAVIIVISKPEFWFLAFLSLFVVVPVVAVNLIYSQRPTRENYAKYVEDLGPLRSSAPLIDGQMGKHVFVNDDLWNDD